MIFQALAWIGAVVACMCGFAWAWMIVVVFMPVTLALNGSRSGQTISRKFLLYPIGAYFVTFLISAIGMLYFHLRFMDAAPTFYILGMHPSEFFLYFFYWIGGVLTVTVGLALRRNEWCSEERWNKFLETIKGEGETA